MPANLGVTPFVEKTLRRLGQGLLTAEDARHAVEVFLQRHGATRAFEASPLSRIFEAALDGRLGPKADLILHELWQNHHRENPDLFLDDGFPPDDEFDDVSE